MAGIGGVIFLILIIEEAFLASLAKSTMVVWIPLIRLILLVSVAFYYQKKTLVFPCLWASLLVLVSNFYILNFSFSMVVLSSLLSFHWYIWMQTLLSSRSGILQSSRKNISDMSVNYYSYFFLATLGVIYFLLSMSSIFLSSVYFEVASLALLFLNFLVVLFSTNLIRFKTFFKMESFVYSSTIISILILFVSGSYIISHILPRFVFATSNANELSRKQERLISMTRKKVLKRDHQKIGYSKELKLSKSSDLKKIHSPEIFLKLDKAHTSEVLKENQIYLRGASFDTYVNNQWSNYYNVSQWLEDGVNNIPDGVIRLIEKPTQLQILKYKVFQLNGWHGTILALPNITEIYIDKVLAEENDTFFLSMQTGNQIQYQVAGGYTTYQEIEDKSTLVLEKRNKKFLSILGDVSDKVRKATLAMIPEEASVADKIESILYYFRQNFRYSLKTENSLNMDPLENFFFHEKKGYCELYTTALAIMLRSVDIPARVSIGYCGGSYVKSIDSYVFFSDEAHAWVEVYFENYGWVVVDATPASHAEQNDGFDESVLAFDEKLFTEYGANETKIRDAKLTQGVRGLLEFLFIAASKDPIVMINLILLTYPISFFLIFGLLKIFRIRKRVPNESNRQNLDFMTEFYQIFGKKQKDETLLEYLEKVKSPKTEQFRLEEFSDYYYKIHYGRAERDMTFEHKLQDRLKEISAQLMLQKNEEAQVKT